MNAKWGKLLSFPKHPLPLPGLTPPGLTPTSRCPDSQCLCDVVKGAAIARRQFIEGAREAARRRGGEEVVPNAALVHPGPEISWRCRTAIPPVTMIVKHPMDPTPGVDDDSKRLLVYEPSLEVNTIVVDYQNHSAS